MKKTWSLLLLVSVILGFGNSALGECRGGTVLPEAAGKRIILADDALFFRTDDIELDIDGSPTAYGLRDQGTENICNGLAPLTPPECRGVASRSCTPHCKAAFRRWHEAGARLSDLHLHMCSVGLGGGSCSRPMVKLQAPPREAWFVSETSLKLAPPEGVSLSDWLQTQDAQVNSVRVPYFVIPGGFRRTPWDATPGDIGAVVTTRGGQAISVGFVVGDTGGRLNEGSAAMLAALSGVDELSTVSGTSALGEPVQRLVGARSGNFRIVIFRHSGIYVDSSSPIKVLNKTATELANWINTEASDRLSGIGGASRVIACTSP